MKLKLMSYNLRCGDDPNGHSIEERAPRVLDILRDYDPEIIGFQEVRPKWEEKLQALTDRYDYRLNYRHPDNLEATPIFWRKDRFELLEEDHFWLSDTPTVPSKGWNADCYRICNYVALRHKETGKVLYFYNTHFDWVGSGPRESAQLIIRKAEKHGDAPVFCTADFNFCPGSDGWHSMRSWFQDVRETIAPNNNQATLNNYSVPGDKLGWLIDFCFYHGKDVVPTHYEVITRTYDGKFPSDHYGMSFEFEIK